MIRDGAGARESWSLAVHGLRYPRSVLLAAAVCALTYFGALVPGPALASEPSRPAIESMTAGAFLRALLDKK